MIYSEKLLETKKEFPFDEWRTYFYPPKDEPELGGMEQYTKENCDSAQKIMDDLISDLIKIGEFAPKKDKENLFKIAVEGLNTLEDEESGIIETNEREKLCELFNHISLVAGLNPEDYADGEGIASEWREW